MKPDIQKINQLILDVLSEEPVKVSHLPFGHSSITYEIKLPTREVILRINTDPQAFKGTERNISTLRQLGLPVPKIIRSEFDTSKYGFAFMLLEKIHGHDLRYELPSMSSEQIRKLSKQIVDFQKIVSKLPQGKGFGYAPIGSDDQFPTWHAMLEHHTSKQETNGSEFETDLLAFIQKQLKRFKPELVDLPATCFLDDLTTKNVIMRDGNLQGIIDLDVVCYGDPLWWLSLVAITIVADVGTEKLTYYEYLCKEWGITGIQRNYLALYQLMHGLNFLVRRIDQPEERQGRMRSYLTAQIKSIS